MPFLDIVSDSCGGGGGGGDYCVCVWWSRGRGMSNVTQRLDTFMKIKTQIDDAQ